MDYGFVPMTRSHNTTRLHDPTPASRLIMTENLNLAESNGDQHNPNQLITGPAFRLHCFLPLMPTIEQIPQYCNTFHLKFASMIGG